MPGGTSELESPLLDKLITCVSVFSESARLVLIHRKGLWGRLAEAHALLFVLLARTLPGEWHDSAVCTNGGAGAALLAWCAICAPTPHIHPPP